MQEEKKYWLGFSFFPGIGPLRFKLLLDYFGSAKRAWQARESELKEIGLGEGLVKKFLAFRNSFSLISCINSLNQKGIRVVTFLDKEYPPLLKETEGAPFLLYVRGDLAFEKLSPCIAVVGTRKVSNYGKEVTAKLVRELVEAGITIVSGMAYGVDTVAHQTAITYGGKTIAVLGCGIDIIHPPSNTNLYWQIVKKYGVIISEFPPGVRVGKGLFPARNRIISGLSLGVVVTEGAEDSGALITARYAAEQGREVFAIPGPITSSLSKGPLKLLREGAKLVSEADDILEELKIERKKLTSSPQNQKTENLSKEERKILELLQNESLSFDEMVKKSQIPAGKLGSFLTLLEMKNVIKKSDNGIYQRS